MLEFNLVDIWDIVYCIYILCGILLICKVFVFFCWCMCKKYIECIGLYVFVNFYGLEWKNVVKEYVYIFFNWVIFEIEVF